jgi:hypothetical protein
MGTAPANSTISVYDGATLIGTATAAADGSWTFTTASLADGTHCFTSTACDGSGNTSVASAALNATIDTAAPNTPTITSYSPDSAVVGDTLTNSSAITLGGTAEAGSIVHVYDGSTLLGTTTADANGVWTFGTYGAAAASPPAFACVCAACMSASQQDSGAPQNGNGINSPLSDGVHTFTVVAKDLAGNASAASSAVSLTIDTAAPAAPAITSFSPDSGTAGDGVTNTGTVTLAGTAEANATIKIYDGATLLGTASANGSGAWSFTTAALANGAHAFTVTATDAAGNTGVASSALTVTVDTAAPVAPTITSFSSDSGTAGDGVTNATTLTLTGTAEANATLKVYDGATLLGTATANGSGAWSFTASSLSTGAHAFTVTATDAAGNTGLASSALTVTVDTAAPVVPTITSFSPDSGTVGDGVTGANQVTLAGTAEANATVKVYDGATLLGTATANGSGAWSFTTATLSNSTHTFTATATDAAGNSSGASSVLSVTVNAVVPTAPAITSFSPDSGTTGDGVTNATTITLTGTAEANATVKIYDGATLLGTATANGFGAWTFATATLSNGTHSLTATATNSVGNTSTASSPLAVNVDTSAPSACVIISFSPDNGTTGDGLTNAAAITLTGTAEANATVKVYDGATLLGTATANGTGAWSFTTASLAGGSHSFTATATDAAGNTGVASSALTVTVDTAAPAAPSITSFSPDSGTAGDGVTNTGSVTLTGTAEANATLKIYDGATLLGTATANGAGAWSFTTASLAGGSHSFTATATDAAGNTGVASSTVTVTIDTAAPVAPTITSFSPDSGTAGDGVTNSGTITLAGTAEANAAVKIYDGATLLGTATANGSGAWSFTTAALTNGAHAFTATATDAAGNTGVASSARTVTIDTAAPVAPTITSFSPDSGTVGDGVSNSGTITLAGTAEANATVKIYDGATLLGAATANGAGAWSFTTASLAGGSHSFTATATDAAGNTGSTSSALSVTIDTTAPVAPTITSFSPDSGTAGDGVTNTGTVTLAGTAEANATVKIYDGATLLGTAAANGAGAWSFTTAALANGTHSLTAKATDAAGNTGSASSTVTVTVDTAAPVAPSITSFSPDSGTAGDGVTNTGTITLAGTAEANATVKIYDGATLLGTASANGSGAWSFTTASLAGGSHSFTATATDAAGNTGVASSTVTVTIDAAAPVAPTITSFSPDSGTTGDGSTSAHQLVLIGTAEANSIVKIFDGSSVLGTTAVNSNGTWSFATTTLSDGTHAFTATGSDLAGNVSTISAALNVDIITEAQSIPVDVTNVLMNTKGGVMLCGTSEAGSTVSVYQNSSLLGQVTATADGTFSFAPGVGSTARCFTFTAVDGSGHTGSMDGKTFVGTVSNDTIVSGTGDDVLAGGYGNDTFVFSGNFGKDTVLFPSSNPGVDIFQFDHATFADFAAVMAHAAQIGTDVVITADANNSVTLHNALLSQLTSSQFHLV